MSAPDTIVIDGHAYSWRRIVELRRRQVAHGKRHDRSNLLSFHQIDRGRARGKKKDRPSLIKWTPKPNY
jgi:hypothetical protein